MSASVCREQRVGTLAMDHNTALTKHVSPQPWPSSAQGFAHTSKDRHALSRLDGGCVFQMSGLRHVAARRARADLDDCAPIPGRARGLCVSSSSADRPWAARCTVTTLGGPGDAPPTLDRDAQRDGARPCSAWAPVAPPTSAHPAQPSNLAASSRGFRDQRLWLVHGVDAGQPWC